jgi:multicomponent Na+:H+ antiporter subunit E
MTGANGGGSRGVTLRRPLTLVWLTLVWLLLWGDISWANLASGVAVAAAVLAVTSRGLASEFDSDNRPRLNVVAAAKFVCIVAWKLVQSNLYLAWEIITPGSRITKGIIAVPLRTDSKVAMLAVSDVITITPGTIVVDVATNPTVLYVHVLHRRDLEKVREDMIELEDLFVRAFGTENDRRRTAGGDT